MYGRIDSFVWLNPLIPLCVRKCKIGEYADHTYFFDPLDSQVYSKRTTSYHSRHGHPGDYKDINVEKVLTLASAEMNGM